MSRGQKILVVVRTDLAVPAGVERRRRAFAVGREPCAKAATFAFQARRGDLARPYPTITVMLASFKPLGLMAVLLPVRTLVLTVIMVPTVAFVLVPLVSRALARWLRP